MHAEPLWSLLSCSNVRWPAYLVFISTAIYVVILAIYCVLSKAVRSMSNDAEISEEYATFALLFLIWIKTRASPDLGDVPCVCAGGLVFGGCYLTEYAWKRFKLKLARDELLKTADLAEPKTFVLKTPPDMEETGFDSECAVASNETELSQSQETEKALQEDCRADNQEKGSEATDFSLVA